MRFFAAAASRDFACSRSETSKTNLTYLKAEILTMPC